MGQRLHRNPRVARGAEREGKATVFLSGLILAGLLAAAAMLPDNKDTEAITTHQGASAQADTLQRPAQTQEVRTEQLRTQ